MLSSTLVHLCPEHVATAARNSRAGTPATAAVPLALHPRMLPTLPLRLPLLPALEMPPICLAALNLLPVSLGIGTGALSK
jgi:hypothetical protein